MAGPLIPDGAEPWLRAVDVAEAGGTAGVDLYADPSRRLRHGDPEGRSMLVSVGAAVLDVRVALAHLALAADTEIDPGLTAPLEDRLSGRSDAPFLVARVRVTGNPPGGSQSALAR